MSIQVTVIMPAYNGEKYIAQAISSVLEQSYRDLELIVIDDGSTDSTREIVLELQKKDSRIKYLYQQNSGQAKARNSGIRAAQGEYIALLDQDDLWLKDKLTLQVAAMRENRVDVVYSSGYVFKDDDIADETRSFEILLGRHQGDEMLRELFALNRIPVLSAIINKNALYQIGLIDERVEIMNCDDYDLWLRLAAAGASFIGMPDKLVRYRKHTNQASQDKIKSLKSEIVVLERYRDNHSIAEIDKDVRYQTVYNDLIVVLLEDRKFKEARECLSRLFRKNKRGLMALLHRLALNIFPGKYKIISYYLYRAKVKSAYLIKDPAL